MVEKNRIGNFFAISTLLCGMFLAQGCEALFFRNPVTKITSLFSELYRPYVVWRRTKDHYSCSFPHKDAPILKEALDGFKISFAKNPKKLYERLNKELSAKFDQQPRILSVIKEIDDNHGNKSLEETLSLGVADIIYFCKKSASSDLKERSCDTYGRKIVELFGCDFEKIAEDMKKIEKESQQKV